MANDAHRAVLEQGVDAWNAWREHNEDILPDLREASLAGRNFSGAVRGMNLRQANLERANLFDANLSRADLSEAWLREADLGGADLSGANLRGAFLWKANFTAADLTRADLSKANLSKANLRGANLKRAILRHGILCDANLWEANLGGAKLGDADLRGANLKEAILHATDLSGASLETAILVRADLTCGNLTGCRIHGISAWDLTLKRTKQQNLVITHATEPEITVDNIEVAQFVYLLLHNPKIRDVIDTIGRKAVLILGRFTPKRKAVLDALREELRKRDYVPILFDFDKPASQDLTATVSTLAHLARFIIADLTDPSSIPHELATVVPTTPIPVKPILLSGSRAFAMFADLRQRHHWVLPIHRYRTPEQLIATLAKKVIAPAEKKVEALQKRRRKIEAELTKPQ